LKPEHTKEENSAMKNDVPKHKHQHKSNTKHAKQKYMDFGDTIDKSTREDSTHTMPHTYMHEKHTGGSEDSPSTNSEDVTRTGDDPISSNENSDESSWGRFPMSKVDVKTIEAISPDVAYDTCQASKYGCEQFCIRLLHGGHRCMCHRSYMLALDGKHCIEQEECDPVLNGCEQLCALEEGRVACQCRVGFIVNEETKKCEDLNECDIAIHECDQICLNTMGSYICQCQTGYRLSSDLMSCIPTGLEDITGKKKNVVKRPIPKFSIPPSVQSIGASNKTVDQGHNVVLRCKTRGHPAPKTTWVYQTNISSPLRGPQYTRFPDGGLLIQQAQPKDTGRYLCIASNIAGTDVRQMFVRVNDVDECAQGTSGCSQLCENNVGSYTCKCMNGYQMVNDSMTCQDLNECELDHDCSQLCWNTPGSFFCSCRRGFQLQSDQRKCQDLDECAYPNMHNCTQLCNNTVGGYLCSCRNDFLLALDNITCISVPSMKKTLINGTGLNSTHISEDMNINILSQVNADFDKTNSSNVVPEARQNHSYLNSTVLNHHHSNQRKNNTRHHHMALSSKHSREYTIKFSILSAMIVISIVLVSATLVFLIRNYKRRMKTTKEFSSKHNDSSGNVYSANPSVSKNEALFNWND